MPYGLAFHCCGHIHGGFLHKMVLLIRIQKLLLGITEKYRYALGINRKTIDQGDFGGNTIESVR